jgi:hypothetical protein
MIIIAVRRPRRPIPAPVRRVLWWLVCAFVVVVFAYEATYFISIMERAGIHHAH